MKAQQDTPATRSSTIAARIKETESEIATLEVELGRIPTQKEILLAKEELDQPALDALEAQEERQAKALANLRVRVSLLVKQQEAAEAEEAGQRLHAIVAEAEKIVEAEGHALAAYDAAVKVLAGCTQVLADLHRQRSELGGEEVFLVERYRLSRLTIPQLKEMPNFFEISSKLVGIFSSARQDSPWGRKRSEWHAQRSMSQSAAARQ